MALFHRISYFDKLNLEILCVLFYVMCYLSLSECGQSKQEIRIVGKEKLGTIYFLWCSFCTKCSLCTPAKGGRPTGVNQFPWLARFVNFVITHCQKSLLIFNIFPPKYTKDWFTMDNFIVADHCWRRIMYWQ